jgi:hypothetical protein
MVGITLVAVQASMLGVRTNEPMPAMGYHEVQVLGNGVRDSRLTKYNTHTQGVNMKYDAHDQAMMNLALTDVIANINAAKNVLYDPRTNSTNTNLTELRAQIDQWEKQRARLVKLGAKPLAKRITF